MSDNTFTENTKTNAEQLSKIRISNVNNDSTETTFTSRSQELNRRSFEDAEPQSRNSDISE